MIVRFPEDNAFNPKVPGSVASEHVLSVSGGERIWEAWITFPSESGTRSDLPPFLPPSPLGVTGAAWTRAAAERMPWGGHFVGSGPQKHCLGQASRPAPTPVFPGPQKLTCLMLSV